MAESPFSRLAWDATPSRPFTLQERFWLQSISDAESDDIKAFVTGPDAHDPALADEMDRLRDLLQARALAIGEERVWQSLAPAERDRLIEIAGERGTFRTEEMARGLIDSHLTIMAGKAAMESGRLIRGPHRTRFCLLGYYPDALLMASEALAEPGAMAAAFPLDRKKKRFGIF